MALNLTEQEELELLTLKRKRGIGSVAPTGQPGQDTIMGGLKTIAQNPIEGLRAAGGIVAGDIGREVKRLPGTLSALGRMPTTVGKDIYETGKGVIQTLQGKQTPGQLGQRLGEGIGGASKAIVEPYTHPGKFLGEQGALNSFLAWYPGVAGAKAVGGAAKRLGGKYTIDTLSGAYGVPKQFIKKRLARSKEIQAAPNLEEYANRLPEVAGKINSGIKQLNDAGNTVLRAEKTIDPGHVLNTIRNIKDKIKPVTSNDMKLIKELNTIENNIIGKMETQPTGILDVKGTPMKRDVITGGFGNKLSEVELKSIIGSLDDSISWGKEGAGSVNDALESLRVTVDSQLKSRNQVYKQIMKPESDLIGLNKEFHKQLGLEKKVGQELPSPTNSTQQKITQAANPKNMATRKSLRKISDYVDEDLLQQIDDVNVKYQFEIARPAGGKRTYLGIGVGGGLGLVGESLGLPHGITSGLGTAGGSLLGATMDTGGPALAKMIDRWASRRGN